MNGTREAERDYYNDLPGKVPPDIGPPPVPPLPHQGASTLPNPRRVGNIQSTPLPDPNAGKGKSLNQWTAGNFIYFILFFVKQKTIRNCDYFVFFFFLLISESDNLIDLSTEGAVDCSASTSAAAEHNYVNDTVIAANREMRKDLFDAFDMRK